MAINLEGVPYGMTEEGIQILNALREIPIADIVEKTDTVETLTKVAVEDMPKFLPEIVKNDFELAYRVCNTGKAVRDCAAQVARAGATAHTALIVGAFAIGLGAWTYMKVKQNRSRIALMEHDIQLLKQRMGLI